MACHTCGGKGHFKRDCPNRKVMIINEDNEYETGDDVDPNAPDEDDYDSDGFDAFPSEAQTIVVSQCVLNVQSSASTHRCNLFQTKALVGPDKACKVIIDGGSCRNLASKELCAKLKLKYLPHPHPYYIQWLSNNGEMKVSHMVRVDFEIGPNHMGGLMGHFGREKTLLMLADHFYWPKMRQDMDRPWSVEVALLKGGDDEDIPTTPLPPSLMNEDEPAVKLKSNEVRIGPITRARAKLLKQQVSRGDEHRTRRGAAGHEDGRQDGREAGQGAGHEDIMDAGGGRHAREEKSTSRPAGARLGL
ncbi:hypothetical protein QYE76_060809 [Lolium multiflorum]|uniref:CCHC-type domain-containing protein n=1 Tax=Lolium multiflorum TaxID=4521 RepID=A0AAD8RZU1_LOLMU|nr:hypothetical protein QYE76_060809 [Lolium multiflorum]